MHHRQKANTLRPRLDQLESRTLLAGVLDPIPHPPALILRTLSPRPTAQRDLPYGDAPVERLDLYLPRQPAPAAGWPVLLAIHGGGWFRFDKSGYGARIAALTRQGYAVAAPNYTLTRPGAPSWPKALNNLERALGWIARLGPTHDLNPEQVTAIGESAGGHLALLLAYRHAQPAAPGTTDLPRVRAVVSFYGPTDLGALERDSPLARGVVRDFLGGTAAARPDRYQEASPLFHVSPAVPPTLLIQGLRDNVVPQSQARALAARLNALGVPHRLMLLPGNRMDSA